MVLSTNDQGKFLREIVSKCATQFSIIPLVPNISSLKIAHAYSQPMEMDEHGIFWGSIEYLSKIVIYLLRKYGQ